LRLNVDNIQPIVQETLADHAELNEGDFKRINELKLGTRDKRIRMEPSNHMSGIQYYFESDIRFVRGPHRLRRRRLGALIDFATRSSGRNRRGWWSGYRGVLSVDICNWFTKSPSTGKPAWESDKQRDRSGSVGTDQGDVEGADRQTIPEPILYHLDTNIRFPKESRRKGLPEVKRDAYLSIGWGNMRPGQASRTPTPSRGRLVFAGTYMQTHTRITTMEAANESGRHAVNAILAASTFQGERCAIFNSRACEPPDLKFLVELDQRFVHSRPAALQRNSRPPRGSPRRCCVLIRISGRSGLQTGNTSGPHTGPAAGGIG